MDRATRQALRYTCSRKLNRKRIRA